MAGNPFFLPPMNLLAVGRDRRARRPPDRPARQSGPTRFMGPTRVNHLKFYLSMVGSQSYDRLRKCERRVHLQNLAAGG
jgi:hypothetical protein